MVLRQPLCGTAPDSRSVHVHVRRNPLDEIDEPTIGGPRREMVMNALSSDVNLPSVASARVGDVDRIARTGAVKQDLTSIRGPAGLRGVCKEWSKGATHGRHERDAGAWSPARARASYPDVGRVAGKTH